MAHEQEKDKPPDGSHPTWKQDLDDVRKVGFWVALFISLPSLAVPALIGSVLEPGKVGVEGITTIWQVIVLTAPLTAAVAIVGAVAARGQLTGYPLVAFSTIVLGIATLLGNMLGISAGVQPPWENMSDGAYAIFTKMVSNYYKAYGPWTFISSLVVGGFLAWVWSEKVRPHLAG